MAGTFVLVHGAWHGGWCWAKVASILRARGHAVLTPTQTGLGERSHLLSKSIDLDVFVDDIANVLRWEDLHDVVLVGHSFGGNGISGVADRMRERVRQLVYLDSIVLENGETPFSGIPPDVATARAKRAQESSCGLSLPPPPAAAFGVTDPEQAAWLEARVTPHPFNTFVSPLRLANPVRNGVPGYYIVCSDPIYAPLQASRDRVRADGWDVVDLPTGHDAMVTAPKALADILHERSK
jgi:pimeloyl-ACP methyl ester carboxylesterase